nr:zinc finger, CCHC-type [Tanacetum cinerariifolium]
MAGNTVKDMTTNFEKLDKFEGYDFRRWQKKMHFFLTTLKELWDSLESKYMAEDSSKESLRAQDRDKGKDKETGHFKRDCHSGKKNNANAGGSGKGLRTNPKTKVDEIEWWIDSSATTHVCKDRCWFKTFEPVKEGSVLYMGDEHFSPVHGKINVALKFSFGKTITLFNVLYVPKLRIIHETTTLYTPQQNGMAERKNRALKEMVNFMLSYSRFYVIEPKVSISKNSIMESRDAIFDDNRFSLIPRPKDIIPNVQQSQMDDHTDDVPNEIHEPQKEAIEDDIGSIMENNSWVLSDLPPGCKPLGFKWIFKRKMKVNGTIDKFAAGLDAAFWKKAIEDEIGYSDTSWINHVEDSSSTRGWMFLLGGALAAAGKEAEGLRNFIHEIPIWSKPIAPISI